MLKTESSLRITYTNISIHEKKMHVHHNVWWDLSGNPAKGPRTSLWRHFSVLMTSMQASSGWGISVCGHLNSSVTCGPVVPRQVVCSAVFLPYLNQYVNASYILSTDVHKWACNKNFKMLIHKVFNITCLGVSVLALDSHNFCIWVEWPFLHPCIVVTQGFQVHLQNNTMTLWYGDTFHKNFSSTVKNNQLFLSVKHFSPS